MLEQEVISHLIKSFHLGVNYLRIYPSTSQMVSVAIDAFHKAIIGIVDKGGSLTFSELSGKLLVEGKESDTREIQSTAGLLLKLFEQRKIQSMTFRQGLTKEELTDFLSAIIRKKREELDDCPHIALDQTVYVAMVKGEETVVRITESIQKSGGEIAGLITSIRESYDLIDQVPDPAARQQLQEHLAQELSRQNTSVLQEIFDRELPPKIEESGLKRRLLSALSQEKIQDIFGEIASWYEGVRQKESSDFAAVEKLGKLKAFLQTILQAPAATEIPRQFFEELLRKGLLSQLPEWFAQEQAKPAGIYEIERLLDRSPAEIIETQTAEGIAGVVEKLCQAENNELLGKLLEKLLENLKSPAAKVRLPAIQAVAAAYEILQTHGKETLLRYLELPVLEAARQETSHEVNFFMMEILRLRARQNVLFGEYERAGRIIDLLRQFRSPEVTADDKLRDNADHSLHLLIPEIVGVLVADLRLDNEVKRLGGFQILARLGEEAVEPLIRVVKGSEDLRNRKLASQALKNLGESARRRFLEELNLNLNSEEIRRVVEALPELGSGEAVEHLHVILRYPDPVVKKEVMRFLAKLDTSQAKALLIEQLKDEDATVAEEAVRLTGENKCREAVPALLALIGRKRLRPTLQEEICIALGIIGDARAATALIARLNRSGFLLFRKQGADTERVRVRAAWALRRFTGPEVEQALEKAGRDKSAPVSLTAKESLTAIRQQQTTSNKRQATGDK